MLMDLQLQKFVQNVDHAPQKREQEVKWKLLAHVEEMLGLVSMRTARMVYTQGLIQGQRFQKNHIIQSQMAPTSGMRQLTTGAGRIFAADKTAGSSNAVDITGIMLSPMLARHQLQDGLQGKIIATPSLRALQH